MPEASKGLKRLVWLYFWLLLLEGALRKWIVPQYSTPLLIVRDPVMILIIIKAASEGLVPRGGFFSGLVLLTFAMTFLMGIQMVMLDVPKAVLVFGWRTNLLHLPLIFLMPRIFNRDDLERMGKWFLLLAIPMAILMTYQFKSPPGAWINKTVGMGEGMQIASAMGKIRPPGTFSFISGPVAFFALVTAFLGYGMIFGGRHFPRTLQIAALVAVGIAVAVSGSRSTILAAGIVVAVCFFSIATSGKMTSGMMGLLVPVVVAFFILGQMDIVQEGSEVISSRWQSANVAERDTGGMVGRLLENFLDPLRYMLGYPPFGHGLGLGTNVGAMLAAGSVQFLLSEGEWGRVLAEMGPLFGAMYLLYRVGLAFWLGVRSLVCVRSGHILPLLLFSACGVNLFSGQFGQATTLGFAVFGAGLCLTAIETSPTGQVR